MSCQKAQEFLEKHSVSATAQTDARKNPQDRDEALKLARSVKRVVVAKGKQTVTFDMTRQPPDDETLLAHLLGPTGNLRAPAIRKGQTLVVGFSDGMYGEELT
jgi:arsenate reductase-like glutaredoxin family protein